ncbi:MAG: urate hydroxylase PuuD [Gemmatimonadales bacterium]
MTALDWLNLALRWAHLIAGIGWIGSSFYFIWLDNHLTAPLPERSREGVEGELWMVHSGGFYQVERRRIGPGRMPRALHWFKWEAALTWITGFLLLSIVYYLSGGVYLVDASVSGIGARAATALGIGVLVASWFVYDVLWRSPAARDARLATALSMLLLAGVTYALCRLLSGRAAYIHVGAMLGTLMVVNVWGRILPAQQQMIDATAAGRDPDFTVGERAKRRSVHNSYMTLPVLFIMLSSHYPSAYGHRLNWLVLLLLAVAGAAVRHVMIAKAGSGRWALVPAAAAAVALLLLVAPPRPSRASGDHVPFAAVRAVITQRCVPCHSRYPSDSVFAAAAAVVVFDTPESIRALAERIRVRAVLSETMPLANRTGMTPDERALVGRWIDGGAQLR